MLELETYAQQNARWPDTGRHILAQFDERGIVVYQAYRPAIGNYAAANQVFGGEFSFNRMSWIKPNFMWMMYRSGWASKLGQEVVLAVRIERAFFDEILACAVHSSFVAEVYGTEAAWKQALAESEVRLQWDPDHGPRGAKLDRRAIQLGLRGEMLRRYATDCVISIDDVSELARRGAAAIENDVTQLETPKERVYIPASAETSAHLGLA